MEASGRFYDPTALHPGKESQYLLDTRLVGVPGPVWLLWRRENYFALAEK
jgi:hypothetical protein